MFICCFLLLLLLLLREEKQVNRIERYWTGITVEEVYNELKFLSTSQKNVFWFENKELFSEIFLFHNFIVDLPLFSSVIQRLHQSIEQFIVAAIGSVATAPFAPAYATVCCGFRRFRKWWRIRICLGTICIHFSYNCSVLKKPLCRLLRSKLCLQQIVDRSFFFFFGI